MKNKNLFKLFSVFFSCAILFCIFSFQNTSEEIEYSKLREFIVSTDEFKDFASKSEESNCLRISCEIINFNFFITLFDINSYQEFDNLVVGKIHQIKTKRNCDKIIFFSEEKGDVIFATILNLPKSNTYPKAYFGKSLTFRIELHKGHIKNYDYVLMDNN